MSNVFIGSYTQHFFPQHTWNQVACQCGEPVQTVEHMLLQCPLYAAARQKHLTANGCLQNLPQVFNHPKCIITLLKFLEEMGVCAKPWHQEDDMALGATWRDLACLALLGALVNKPSYAKCRQLPQILTTIPKSPNS